MAGELPAVRTVHKETVKESRDSTAINHQMEMSYVEQGLFH